MFFLSSDAEATVDSFNSLYVLSVGEQLQPGSELARISHLAAHTSTIELCLIDLTLPIRPVDAARCWQKETMVQEKPPPTLGMQTESKKERKKSEYLIVFHFMSDLYCFNLNGLQMWVSGDKMQVCLESEVQLKQ